MSSANSFSLSKSTSNCNVKLFYELRPKKFFIIGTRTHLGPDVVLYTTDGNSNNFVRCGKTSEVYATVDFGPG